MARSRSRPPSSRALASPRLARSALPRNSRSIMAGAKRIAIAFGPTRLKSSNDAVFCRSASKVPVHSKSAAPKFLCESCCNSTACRTSSFGSTPRCTDQFTQRLRARSSPKTGMCFRSKSLSPSPRASARARSGTSRGCPLSIYAYIASRSAADPAALNTSGVFSGSSPRVISAAIMVIARALSSPDNGGRTPLPGPSLGADRPSPIKG